MILNVGADWGRVKWANSCNLSVIFITLCSVAIANSHDSGA